MTSCRGCGREGLKRSGINLHCRKSHDPRCKAYLAHLKQAAGIRTHRLRSPAEHAPTATLNVSPSTGEASQVSNNLRVSKKRTFQMTFVDDSDSTPVTLKRSAVGRDRQGGMPTCKTLEAEYSPTPTVDDPPTTAEIPNHPSTSEVPADSLSKECTVQMTFVDNLVSSSTKNVAFVPEDQMRDVPCELLLESYYKLM